jgi:pilus assembly protein Flp/PilA
MSKLIRFVKDESGATAIEYGLIAAAMGIAIITAMPTLTSAWQTNMNELAGNM